MYCTALSFHQNKNRASSNTCTRTTATRSASSVVIKGTEAGKEQWLILLSSHFYKPCFCGVGMGLDFRWEVSALLSTGSCSPFTEGSSFQQAQKGLRFHGFMTFHKTRGKNVGTNVCLRITSIPCCQFQKQSPLLYPCCCLEQVSTV